MHACLFEILNLQFILLRVMMVITFISFCVWAIGAFLGGGVSLQFLFAFIAFLILHVSPTPFYLWCGPIGCRWRGSGGSHTMGYSGNVFFRMVPGPRSKEVSRNRQDGDISKIKRHT